MTPKLSIVQHESPGDGLVNITAAAAGHHVLMDGGTGKQRRKAANTTA
jgi:hypothetical protein